MPDRIRAGVLCLSLVLLAWSLALRAEGAQKTYAGGAPEAREYKDPLSRQLISSLETRYPGARIEVAPGIRWTNGRCPDSTTSVTLFEETANGEVRLRAEGESFDADTQAGAPVIAEGYASFSAFVPAWIANRRIFPGERLDLSAFSTQDVNVATAQYRDVRGLILTDQTLSSLQTRQTVLEGSVLLATAVERVPDVRRGDAIRINLVSGDLTLTVPGTAQEPAYLSGHVRVITDRTKRELVGELEPGGIVEVKL